MAAQRCRSPDRVGANARYRISWMGAWHRPSTTRTDHRRHLPGARRRARPNAGSRRARTRRSSPERTRAVVVRQGDARRQPQGPSPQIRPPSSRALRRPLPRANSREPLGGHTRDARFAAIGGVSPPPAETSAPRRGCCTNPSRKSRDVGAQPHLGCAAAAVGL